MRFMSGSVAILVSFLLLSMATVADEIAYSALIGKWRAEKAQASGVVVKVELEIKADRTFAGIALVNDVPQWTYAGNLELEANELTWIYIDSSRPIPPKYRDVDLILSVEENQFTYKAKLSGEVNTFVRIK